MATRRETSGKYNKVDPDEYYQYEEQYVEKGSGGSGGKVKDRQGAKTMRSLKIHQRRAALDQRQEKLEDGLLMVLDNLPGSEDQEQNEESILQYVSWIEENLAKMSSLDPSQLEVSFSKSGGPGGQNVNKRETKVSIVHKPTKIRVVNDQSRSQKDNRRLAEEGLRKRLEDHLRDWKMYLGGQRTFDIMLVKDLLEKG